MGGVFGHPVSGEDAGGGQVERQGPAGERAQHLIVEPSPQVRSLLRVCAFLAEDPAFDLCQRCGRDELLGGGNRVRPPLYRRVAFRQMISVFR